MIRIAILDDEKADLEKEEQITRQYFDNRQAESELSLIHILFTKTPVKEQIICSVDLGINTDAVCTIMRADGTVLGDVYKRQVCDIRRTCKLKYRKVQKLIYLKRKFRMSWLWNRQKN